MNSKILNSLIEIVGKKNVLTSKEELFAYSYDALHFETSLPLAVVIPNSVEDISKIFYLANEEKFGIVPRGSGTGLSGGAIPTKNSIVLLMNKWKNILEIDENNLTATVESGVITGEFQSIVESKDLFYPPDPGSSMICTLGGNCAENAGGLRGLKYGVTKNYILGMEVVLPNGDITFLGGKNVKDVAGYNLKDVLIGSEGTLCIFTKLLLKLLPKPQTQKTMLVTFENIFDASKTVSDIIKAKILPSTLEFMDNVTVKSVQNFTKINLDTTANGTLLIECDGNKFQVDEEIETIKNICKINSAIKVKIAETYDEVVMLKSTRKSAYASLARSAQQVISEDVVVPRSELSKIVEKIQTISKNNDIPVGIFGHFGDGNIHPLCLLQSKKIDENKLEKMLNEIYEATISLGGSITGEHGIGLAKKDFLPKAVGDISISFMKSLKNVLDKNDILNPGKIFSPKTRCEGYLPKNIEQIKNFETQLWI